METGTVRRIQEEITRIENTVEEGGDLYSFCSAAKIRCLQHMLVRAKESQKWIKPQVFVSYTGAKGYDIMLAVRRSINMTRAQGTNTTFHGTGGMDQRGDSQPEVLEHILEKLRPCSIFVGILTREWEIAAKEGSGGFGPGGWSLIETGMALSLGLRVLLFVDNGLNEKFWRLYLGHIRHVAFELDSYSKSIDILMLRIQEAYKRLREEKH